MKKENVINTWLAHQAELKELSVDHLTLLGSVARDEAWPDSDVDLLATFAEAKALSLLTVIGFQRKISELLDCPVDLGNATAVMPRLKPPLSLTWTESSKRDPKLWLGDMLDGIQEIEDATHQVEAETFVNNHRLIRVFRA
jgi:predicted nucleotidyltransferase